MNLTRDRLQSIGWAFVLGVCAVLTLALGFRVNAVKSEVRLAERQIVMLKRQKVFLETEFQTRANQQQLRNLNEVEFGYVAPSVNQYIEGERQLAALGKPRSPDAPEPIQVAVASIGEAPSQLAEMVSPITGKPLTARTASARGGFMLASAGLDERLSMVARGTPREASTPQ